MPCPEVVAVFYIRPAEVPTLVSVKGDAQVERQNTVVGFLTLSGRCFLTRLCLKIECVVDGSIVPGYRPLSMDAKWIRDMVICPFREFDKNTLARPFRWAVRWFMGFLGGSVKGSVLAPVPNLPREFFYLINVDDVLTFDPISGALSNAHL